MISYTLMALCAVILTMGLTKWYIAIAQAGQFMDKPNVRSSHSTPVPLGGGVAFLIVIIFLWPLFAWPLSMTNIVALAALLVLALVSWLDDRNSLPWWSRLAVQLLCAGTLLFFLPGQSHIFPWDMPLILDRLIAGLAWVWFINLYNFMDGIDGLAGGEALTIATGLVAISSLALLGASAQILAVILAGAMVGFLWWNWHPAKVFMGDVGSIPLGFALGWLLIDLAVNGHFAAAIILPLYFLADATITLFRRLVRGEKVWQAHREHFYQRAVQPGSSHARVVLRILGVNILLIALALLSLSYPLLALALATMAVASFIVVLQQMAATQS